MSKGKCEISWLHLSLDLVVKASACDAEALPGLRRFLNFACPDTEVRASASARLRDMCAQSVSAHTIPKSKKP